MAAGQPLECVRTPGLAVDADGAPDSYRLDGRGLSDTCDGAFAVVNGVAHTPLNDKANWLGLCRQYWKEAVTSGDYSRLKIVGFLKDAQGRPVLQGKDDPLPGQAFVTTTSLTLPGHPDTSQRRYVNASEIPYVVLSPAFATRHHLRLGDLVAVYRIKTAQVAYAVYGDCCSLGEGSIRLHQDLGSNPLVTGADGTRRAKRGIADPVGFVALTGAHTTPTLDAKAWRQEIRTKGEATLQALGGVAALKIQCR